MTRFALFLGLAVALFFLGWLLLECAAPEVQLSSVADVLARINWLPILVGAGTLLFAAVAMFAMMGHLHSD